MRLSDTTVTFDMNKEHGNNVATKTFNIAIFHKFDTVIWDPPHLDPLKAHTH